MKKVVLLSGLLLSACGGGGGDDDIGGEGSLCRSFCEYGCQKTWVCGGSPVGFDHLGCANTCSDTIARDGVSTEQSCYEAGRALTQMTCDELFTALGLRKVGKSLDATEQTLGLQLGTFPAE